MMSKVCDPLKALERSYWWFLVYAHSNDAIERTMLSTQVPTIVGMVKGCSSVNIVENNKEVPDGCGSQVLSPSLTIYILVKVNSKVGRMN
jgi:hypothetical protein